MMCFVNQFIQHDNTATPIFITLLRWQNAHLQAEVRHYQTALSSTKAELQNLFQNRVGNLKKTGCGMRLFPI